MYRTKSKKASFRLAPEDRNDMMDKIMQAAKESLVNHKMSGTSFTEIAATLGLPKQRVSAILHGRYMGERAFQALVRHGYVKMEDMMDVGLSDRQMDVVKELVSLTQNDVQDTDVQDTIQGS